MVGEGEAIDKDGRAPAAARRLRPGARHPSAEEDAGSVPDHLSGGEREAVGPRLRVEGAPELDLVGAEWQRRQPSLECPVRGGPGVEQEGGAQHLHLVGLGIEALQRVRPERDVEAEAEQAALAAGDGPGDVLGVVGGDLRHGVGDTGLGKRGGKARPLLLEVAGRRVVGDRIEVQGNVGGPPPREQRLEPACGDLPGPADDGEGAEPHVPGPDGAGRDLERLGGRKAIDGGMAGPVALADAEQALARLVLVGPSPARSARSAGTTLEAPMGRSHRRYLLSRSHPGRLAHSRERRRRSPGRAGRRSPPCRAG